jgi:3-hydroxybutyryl-CoA dehydrogenase
MNKISIIGAGTMGLDIGQMCAQSGYFVIIRDVNDDIIARAKAKLDKNLSRLVEKGKITPDDKQRITGSITFTTDLNTAVDSDLVVEAIIEDISLIKGAL